MKNKFKTILLLSIVFSLANIFVYYFSETNKSKIIKSELENNLNDLKTHIDILLYNQKINAYAISVSTLQIPQFLEIFSKIDSASKKEKDRLRDELHKLLKQKYRLLKTKGVLQYQFVLPNNKSFLRMHKPSKFGDDLSEVRDDFKYVNTNLKPIIGFNQGRTAHAFRNVYPIFDKNKKYLGAMEVSFSSDSFQEYLTKISKIHTHFLVDKKVFTKKAWNREDLILKYIQSSEHKNYMLTLNLKHTKEKCIIENKLRIKNIKIDMMNAMDLGNKFSLYTSYENKVIVASAFPIYNILNTKVLAWFVSYHQSDIIKTEVQSTNRMRLIFLILFLILGYVIYKQIQIKEEIVLEQKLLDDVLNSTDDIMFVTDFKLVSFANRKFKDFFNVMNLNEFNENTKNNLLSIFLKADGFLHLGLLEKNQNIIDFMESINEEDRIVKILDKSINPKSFVISITKTNHSLSGEYLVTLNDITLMKEKEAVIQKKAYTDSLTKVYNRTKFDEISKKEFDRNIRYKRDLSIAILDIDNFKKFNDNYGHLVGDEVLVMLAKHLNDSVRSIDTFARWGGEEFVILFPETKKEEAKIICEKIRVSLAQLSHHSAGSITVSFGVTQYEDNDTVDGMFKRCDEALYEAKENGRNMVCVK